MGNNSNRNSLKEAHSNRSSMDVSTCSYNTLIIHNDHDNAFVSNGVASSADYGSKKDRPRSFGTDQVIKEILETSEPDYSNHSSVLKQLVKEMKLPTSRDHAIDCARLPPKYGVACGDRSASEKKVIVHADAAENDEVHDGFDADSEDQSALSKLKSKSQPDLSRIIDIDLDTIEALMKDNMLLKEQLNHCYKKVAKTKKV